MRNDRARANASASNTGTQLTGVALASPGILADEFVTGDWVSVKVADPQVDDEPRTIVLAGPGTFDLAAPPLPAAFHGQAVDVRRLDRPVLKIEKDGSSVACTLSFRRGRALHFRNQLPSGFDEGTVHVSEYLTGGVRRQADAGFPAQPILLRVAEGGNWTGYAAADFVRVLSGNSYSARLVDRVDARGSTLTAPLDGTPRSIDATRMTSGGAALPGQGASAAGAWVSAGAGAAALAGLAPHDGVTVENTGVAGATAEPRIVTGLYLDCAVASLPAALQAVDIRVDVMNPAANATTQASGSTSAASEITTNAGEAGRFAADEPVRVTKAAATHAYGVVASVDSAANTITLTEPLPATDFAPGTAVIVIHMTGAPTFQADQVSAPSDHVIIATPRADSLAVGSVIRVRPAADSAGGALRTVSVDPALIAGLDSALPNTHTSGLTVQRYVPDAASRRTGVAAPPVRWRLTITSGTNPYTAGDTLYINGTIEEAIGEVLRVNAMQVDLTHPVERSMNSPVQVDTVMPTGIETPDAQVAEGLIMAPSDPEETYSRRRALEMHEMRHVFQGAIWGPMMLSLPVPWLLNMGFSFTSMNHSAAEGPAPYQRRRTRQPLCADRVGYRATSLPPNCMAPSATVAASRSPSMMGPRPRWSASSRKGRA